MLQLPKKTLFAVEAIIDIAYHARPNPVQSTDIAARQGNSRRYLEPILQRLVRAGILRGVRGPKGGYRLARERRRISVGEIIRIFLVDEPGSPLAGSDSTLGRNVVGPFWREIEAEMLAKLDTVTIEDLCRSAETAGVGTETAEPADFSI